MLPLVLFFFLLLCVVPHTLTTTDEILVLQDRVCTSAEYLSPTTFSCTLCNPDKNLVASQDKVGCVCNEKSVQVSRGSDGLPECRRCKSGQQPASDRSRCVACPRLASNASAPTAHTCSDLCPPNNIILDRELDGRRLEVMRCLECSEGSGADPTRSVCIPCSAPGAACGCPRVGHQLLPRLGCVSTSLLPTSSSLSSQEMFQLSYQAGPITSNYLYENLVTALVSCKLKNVLGCEWLANMCVLGLYEDSTPRGGGACGALRELRSFEGPLPKLYYPEGEAAGILRRKSISQRFSLDPASETSGLSFAVSSYWLNGSWIGLRRGSGPLLGGPCSSSAAKVPIRFASEYTDDCQVSAQQLIAGASSQPPIFFEMYLVVKEKNLTILHPIPVLITNYRHHKKFVNKADMSQWQLIKRVFTVDTVAGQRFLHNSSSPPHIYRYLKSATLRLHIKTVHINNILEACALARFLTPYPNILSNGLPSYSVEVREDGRIYPPLLRVTYAELTQEDLDKDKNLQISFRAHFYQQDNSKKTFDIWLGVLCSLSALWSMVRTWADTKRSGGRPIDLLTVLQLCILASGHLSNVFFLVSSGAALHSFVYYKWQIIPHVLLPSPKLTYLVRTYAIVAFPLKMVEVLYLIWSQLRIDIFLIDWEQPRMQQKNISVSAWRSYFVSNKWNDIQTERRTSLLLQISFTVLFLKVCGVEMWSLCLPELHTQLTPNLQHYNNRNRVHRFAIGVLVYSSVYLIQSVFMATLYERYIKNPIQEFVDFCSLANISVFIFAQENYGYYIHGRSVHGFSDTDMGTLKCQLRREEEDLVGHRGLLPASDHQTFRILLPHKLHFFYRSLLPPQKNVGERKTELAGGGGRSGGPGPAAGLGPDFTMQSYVTINRFLAAFIEHALKDLDYEVKEKHFIEALLDIELRNGKNKGTFYNDNGHSFDQVLYYGNESTLFTFNLILFSFVEILTQDFLLAAVITIFSDEYYRQLTDSMPRCWGGSGAMEDERTSLERLS